MSDYHEEAPELDETMERELTRIAPAVRRRRQAEAETADPAFVRALERRLLGDEAGRPVRAERRGVAFPWRWTPRARWITSTATAIAAAAALVAGILLSQSQGPATAPVALVPVPSTSDLTRGFPALGPGGGGGAEYAISSPIGIGGGSYPAHLQLSAPQLPAAPSTLPAYLLAGSGFDATRAGSLARVFGILAPLTLLNDADQPAGRARATWITATEGGLPTRRPLHSVAVSLISGELIYHDLRYQQLAYHGAAISRDRAAAIARAWLIQAGWPGKTMPVLSVAPEKVTGPPGPSAPLAVSFGWPDIGPSNVPAAVLWVAPTGRVTEALVWPPVAQQRQITGNALRAPGTAWELVQAGKAPIALNGAVLYPYRPGKGLVTSTSTIEVLVTPPHSGPYLVPAYCFAGTVRLEGQQRTSSWYALVPAASPG